MLKKIALNTVQFVDKLLLRAWEEPPELTILIFHKIFSTEEEAQAEETLPTERMTLAAFEEILQHWQQAGYHFISPEALEEGANFPHKKNILLTFDDGYFNNSWTVPILEKHNAPALFFIATDYVKLRRPYWWDVLYRESHKRGKTHEEVRAQIESYKAQTREAIEAELKENFGEDAFIWRELDRPFTPEELREFAAHPLVHLGNHTASHYALAHWPLSVVQDQLAEAQAFLREEIGVAAPYFAYPNGSRTPEVEAAVAQSGLFRLAITIQPEKNYLPLQNLFTLGRFGTSQKPVTALCTRIAQTRTDRQPPLEAFLRKTFQD